MASTRFFFELCIFSVALHFAFAINARELRKINVRINKIETDHHRRINDLELEVQYLKLELDEQRTNGDGMSPGSESRGHPIPAGVTDHIEQLEKALVSEREIRVKLQHKQTVMQGKIDKIEQFIAESIVSVQFTKQMFETLRKAFHIEKSSIRNLSSSMQQNINHRLFNISESVRSSVEDIQKIQNSTLKLNMERTEQLNHDLNAVQSIVDSNTVAINDVKETIMELRVDDADRNTHLQRINEAVEQVKSKIEIWEKAAINGVWGQWSSFTECSRPCYGGIQTRRRACDSPAPSGVGDHCPGDAEESQSCNSGPCPEDCSGITASGVYDISPSISQATSVPVYCDVSSDGAWTVIQKRNDGSVDFKRTWAEYKTGFGNVGGEYWLGNEALHHITTRGNYKLKVVLTDWKGVTKVAQYSTVRIGSESDGYQLTVRGYSGDAGDSMAWNDRYQFTTTDRDNDRSSRNCAEVSGRGGWWYSSCTFANLNGVYHHTPSATDWTGIYWSRWHGYDSLKTTTMMIQKT